MTRDTLNMTAPLNASDASLIEMVVLRAAEVGVAALVAWVWALWMSHMRHKEEIAREFVRKSELGPRLDRIEAMVLQLHGLVNELKGQLHGSRN